MFRKSAALMASAVMAFAAPAHAQSLIRDAEIESVLEGYTDPIMKAAGLNEDDVEIYIVNDPTMNAFVTGGQNIFIHTGIILEADEPNEIVGVLAHETGHIAGGHLLRTDEAEKAAISSMLLSMGVGLLAVMAGASDAGAAMMASGQTFGALSFMGHTRQQESRTDQAALRYMEAAGVNPEGMLGFFERFRNEEILAEHQQSPYFRTHPLSSDRITALRTKVRASPYFGKEDSEEAKHELAMIQAKIYGYMESPQQTYRVYPLSDDSQPARYAQAVAQYRSGSLSDAIETIDSLIAEEPENPYFHELKGQMYYESGDAQAAVGPYRRAAELKPDNALIQVGLAQTLIESDDQSDLEEAERLLKDALRKEPENGAGWYALSRAYQAQGETDLAQLAVAEQSYAGGDFARAAMFAHRAKEGLQAGTVEWRRASDILATSEPQVREQVEAMERRRRR